MRRSLMVLGLLLASAGVASAQMGPAGPGGGSYSGGVVHAWAGMSAATNVPSGSSVTFTFTPTVSGLPIYRIEYKDAYSGAVLSSTGTTCTIQPGQSGTLNVVATAYDWFGSIVDVAATPVPVTWEPPHELVFSDDGGPHFKVVDRFGQEMGPGAAYQIEGSWTFSFYGGITSPGSTGTFGGLGSSYPTLYGPAFSFPWTVLPTVLTTKPEDNFVMMGEVVVTYRFRYPTFNGYTMTTGYTTIGPMYYTSNWIDSEPGGPPVISVQGPIQQ